MSDTSSDAFDSIKNDAPRLQQMIEAYIKTRRHDGATCDEVEVALGLRHQTCSARFTELRDRGHTFKKRPPARNAQWPAGRRRSRQDVSAAAGVVL